MAAMAEAPYPVTLELLAAPEIARWRPLVHWLLSIPYYIVLYILQIALGVVTLVAWFVILFTGNLPDGMFDFMPSVHRSQWRFSSYYFFLGVHRWAYRVQAYVYLLTDAYPPFRLAP